MSTIALDASVVRLDARPRAAAAARPVARGGQVRLTRRGRVVVLAFALLVVLAVGVLLGGGSVASEEAGQAAPTQIVTVNEGDTLWGIAAEIAEDGKVRDVMAQIEHLNALESPVLALGQKLRVPVAD